MILEERAVICTNPTKIMDGVDWGNQGHHNPTEGPKEACTMPPDSLTGGIGMTDLINDFAFHRLMICLKTVSPKISGSSTWLKGLRNNCKRVAIFLDYVTSCCGFFGVCASTALARLAVIEIVWKWGNTPRWPHVIVVETKIKFSIIFSTDWIFEKCWGVFHQFKILFH